MILPLVIGSDKPILREKTQRVGRVTKKVLKLLKDMEETMLAANGAGLAAPQVGESVRACVALIGGKTVYLIDPEITCRSDETEVLREGCLSLPGVTVAVERPMRIRASLTDGKGVRQERELSGFDARVVQHELDHLEGILIVDHQKMRTT